MPLKSAATLIGLGAPGAPPRPEGGVGSGADCCWLAAAPRTRGERAPAGQRPLRHAGGRWRRRPITAA
eukprot:15482141-Alexandrium_andersonii.AAC.1